MPKVKLELNEPYEGALKFAKGRYYPSTIPGNPGSTMYSLETGEVLFLEHTICDEPDELFKNAKVTAHQAFSITLRKRNGQRYYEVHNLNHAEPVEPTSKIEADLQASVEQAKERRQSTPVKESAAASATVGKPGPAFVSPGATTTNPTPLETIGHTGLSQILSGCMIAAIDSAAVAREYAHAKGLTISFTEQSIQDLTSTLMIHLQRMAELECKYDIKAAAALSRANGGATWRQ